MADEFRFEDYEPVADRLAKFWHNHPTGRVHTELIEEVLVRRLGDEREEYIAGWIVKAAIYGNIDDAVPIATGIARQEFLTEPPLTAKGKKNVYAPEWTSPVEVAETSAIGRALANMGYATKRPSREEMGKARKADPVDAAWVEVLALVGGDEKTGKRLWFAARDRLGIPDHEALASEDAEKVLAVCHDIFEHGDESKGGSE